MRVYVLEYDFYLPSGGSFKYALNPTKEHRVETYTLEERQLFLKNYQRYKKDDLIYDNVKAYGGDIPEINNMEVLINSL